MQQQHEKIRKKRDYTTLGGGGYQNQRVSLLRNVAPDSRVEYRDTNSHNFFPDPLFKEQWYLVSIRFRFPEQTQGLLPDYYNETFPDKYLVQIDFVLAVIHSVISMWGGRCLLLVKSWQRK